MERIVYLAGFPRSGSTVLANILGMHPDVKATPSSPLCATIQNMRRGWSDDPFLLAQLDNDSDEVHERLRKSMIAFMNEFSFTKEKVVVDKNRGWLGLIQTLKGLYPDFQIIITLRDPRDIFASIEKRHEKTLMFDFPDHMEHNVVDGRANALFADNGIIGGIFRGIKNIGDIPNIIDHVYFWRFEDFLMEPEKSTEHLFEWLKLKKQKIDFNKIKQSTKESDSFYRMKYLHKIKTKLEAPNYSCHPGVREKYKDCADTITLVSPRILEEIAKRFMWFYQQHYPEYFPQPQKSPEELLEETENLEKEIESEIASELEKGEDI